MLSASSRHPSRSSHYVLALETRTHVSHNSSTLLKQMRGPATDNTSYIYKAPAFWVTSTLYLMAERYESDRFWVRIASSHHCTLARENRSPYLLLGTASVDLFLAWCRNYLLAVRTVELQNSCPLDWHDSDTPMFEENERTILDAYDKSAQKCWLAIRGEVLKMAVLDLIHRRYFLAIEISSFLWKNAQRER